MNDERNTALFEGRDAQSRDPKHTRPATAPSVVPPSIDGDGLANSAGHLAAIDRLNFLAEATGLPFLCVEVDGGAVLAKSASDVVPFLPWDIRSQLDGVSGLRLMQLDSGLIFYALPLPAVDDHQTVAVGYVLQRRDDRPRDVQSLAAELGWSEAETDRWCFGQRCCDTDILERLLSNVLESEARQNALNAELDTVVDQVERTCQEIGVLHTLTSHLELNRSPLDLAEQCVNGLYDLTGAEGSLAVVDGWQGQRHLLVKGQVPLEYPE